MAVDRNIPASDREISKIVLNQNTELNLSYKNIMGDESINQEEDSEKIYQKYHVAISGNILPSSKFLIANNKEIQQENVSKTPIGYYNNRPGP